jgi:hypothetical protein
VPYRARFILFSEATDFPSIHGGKRAYGCEIFPSFNPWRKSFGKDWEKYFLLRNGRKAKSLGGIRVPPFAKRSPLSAEILQRSSAARIKAGTNRAQPKACG